MSAAKPEKSFDYHSNERQTATTFDEIRIDHSMRYRTVPVLVPELMKRKPHNVLDVFCGNGYGAWFLANELGCSVTAIDGSSEAIDMANKHFSLPNTFFSAKIFPFQLPQNTYDVVCCFESIEHVDDPESFFAELAGALKPGGLFFVSTPNEKVLPFEINKHFFRHHTKHFTHEELVALGDQHGLDVVILCGQNVYNMEGPAARSVNHDLPMNPDPFLENPQFFLHVYQKPDTAVQTDGDTTFEASGGTDSYNKGIIQPDLLKNKPLKLDIGCGELGPEGDFVGVDIRPVHPRIAILSDTWSLGEFLPSNSVNEIFSRHTLEHITFPQLDKTLISWLDLLEPGGRVRIMVPDLAFHIHQFLDPNYTALSPASGQWGEWTQRQHALAGFYGWQREADTKLWDVHKSGNTFETFKDTLERLGFERVKRLENQPWHLDLEAFKPQT